MDLVSKGAMAAAFGAAFATSVSAGTLTPTEAENLIRPLYAALTASEGQQIRPLLESVTSEDWRNCSAPDRCETRDQTIERWSKRLAAVPEFKLIPEEVLISGDCIIVRSVATGRPAGTFQGIATEGRLFRIMTLDIHRVSGGLIVETFHLEDWARANRQLSGNE